MNFFNCCYTAPTLSVECLQQIDKALGNIKNSHKAISFIGVVQVQGLKANMLQYQYNHLAGGNTTSMHGSNNNLNSQSAQQNSVANIKDKVEKILERTVSFKIAQKKIAREMGFDSSKEVFIKGEQSVIIVYEVPSNSQGTTNAQNTGNANMGNQPTGYGYDQCFLLVIFLEMNALKVEFFDCETFITTIDDLVVSLIDALNYDNSLDSAMNDNQDDNRGGREKNH
eukprot:403333704